MGCTRRLNEDARIWLKTHLGEYVRFGEPMARHTSFRVGGPAEGFITPPGVEVLARFLRWAGKAGIPYHVIGDGTNLLVKDGGIEGIVVSLGAFRGIEAEEHAGGMVTVRVRAGVRLKHLCQYAARNGLEGMTFALGIPGTIGGGIMMNAGTSGGAMTDALVAVTLMDTDGVILEVEREHFRSGYRFFSWSHPSRSSRTGGEVLLGGSFRLRKGRRTVDDLRKEAVAALRVRKSKQPIGIPSAGCFFKNPSEGASGAGELIERAGLKGRRIGDAEVSSKHANFILNRGCTSSSEILALAEVVKDTVKRKFGVTLEPEVRIFE